MTGSSMAAAAPAPLVSDLLLIGGGHAQIHVIKMCGMEPLRSTIAKSGVRVTLIAKDVMTPYSGMLPGYVAGHYTYERIHIDLNRLCSFAGVRLIHAAATRIDASSGTHGGGSVHCDDGRPPVRYDAVSIDVGSYPSGFGSREEDAGVTPVKPISGFAARYARLVRRLRSTTHDNAPYDAARPFVLLVVGGGAGGIELALAAQHNLTQVFREIGLEETALKIILATRGDSFLQGHSSKAQQIFRRILKERKVEVRFGAELVGVEGSNVNASSSGKAEVLTLNRAILSASSKDQPPIQFHECLWCTSAGASSWLSQNTPFVTTSDGFLEVQDTFESVSHRGVFAAGDCCHMVDHPRPKAGVFAVRAGPPLLANLFHFLMGRPLEPFSPQKENLGLISTGNKYAVASKGSFAFEAAFLWKLKDHIDGAFMDKFSILPSMVEEGGDVPSNVVAKGAQAMAAFAAAPMRCGGCGAKVGATTVSRVLEAVRQRRNSRRRTAGLREVVSPFDADDAAVVALPAQGGGSTIHTIDFFRSFISDPFVFGKIAAVHALSDCHAMGAATQTCLALAVVPYSAEESITEDTLISMLAGASDILETDNCELVGGHTCEGAELSLGFAVNGYVSDPSKLLRKSGGRVGDKIVITKPIGTGAIFAADMRAKSSSVYVNQALEMMTKSNGPASRVAMKIIEDDSNRRDIHSCTDVTGFALAGHLLEMLTANDECDSTEKLDSIGAVLDLNKIPFLEGAVSASQHGIYSSLQRENSRTRRAVTNHTEAAAGSPIKYPLIFDPQTAGGLLFFVSSDFTADFVSELEKPENGGFACVIGDVIPYQKPIENVTEDGVCTIGGGGKGSGQRITIRF